MLQYAHNFIAGLLAALSLGACSASPYRGSNLQEAKGDGASVVITHARNESEARPLADGYCSTLGSAARFTGMVQYRTRREVLKAASFKCEPQAASHLTGLDEIPRLSPVPTASRVPRGKGDP